MAEIIVELLLDGITVLSPNANTHMDMQVKNWDFLHFLADLYLKEISKHSMSKFAGNKNVHNLTMILICIEIWKFLGMQLLGHFSASPEFIHKVCDTIYYYCAAAFSECLRGSYYTCSIF